MTTVKIVGLSIGTVTYRNRCHAFAWSIIAASSISGPMLCRPAMNRSMNVPEVVKMAIMMKALIATDGPASHSHHEMPRNSLEASASGAVSRPKTPRTMCSTPRGSSNQFGPSIANHDSTLLTTPVGLNRNSHSTVMATELVTDGK